MLSKWFFSLQFRLIVGFALILALALGSVSVYLGLVAHREVDRIQREVDEARANRVTQILSQSYAANKGWGGIQAIITRAGFLSEREILVLYENGEVVGHSDERSRGPTGLSKRRRSKMIPITLDRRKVGSVIVGFGAIRPGGSPRLDVADITLPPGAQGSFDEPSLARFAQAMNRSLLWAGLAAGAGGILLVSFLSRRMLAPAKALSLAAQALGSGDLGQRVPAPGRDDIGELGRSFNAMAESLEDAERQRRDMVADVAHELRSPLSNIQGYVEAMRDGLVEPDAASLDALHQQVLYLTRLLEDLRLLAETESGSFRLSLALASLGDVIRETVHVFQPKADTAGVIVGLTIPDELPSVTLDDTRIRQVVGNLMDNTIRHTPSGGRITVSVALVQSSSIRVIVADTGDGIPTEAQPHVFERLYRVDPSRDRTTGGAGLGLTIARQLVEAHGGSIRVDSTPGEGSSFTVDLPR